MTATSHPRTRIGILGAGNIGSAYAEAIGQSEQLICSAIADADAARAGSLAARVGAAAFADLDAFVDAAPCDVVVVCTPPNQHEHHTVRILDAGLDVLCEKPFALGLDAAERMFRAGNDNGRLLGMASKFRYVDDLIRARHMIASGRIGEPITAEVRFASTVDMSGRWNSVPAISGGGALIDNGTHAVDIVRYLVGDIRRVSAMSRSCMSSSAVEDTGVIIGETAGGAIATMSVSWAIAPVGGSYVTVHGTDGAIDVGWSGSRYRCASDDWVAFGSGYAKFDALRGNVESFAAARAGREPLRNSASDVLASVAVIEAAYEAIAVGTWVEPTDVWPITERLGSAEVARTAVSSA